MIHPHVHPHVQSSSFHGARCVPSTIDYAPNGVFQSTSRRPRIRRRGWLLLLLHGMSVAMPRTADTVMVRTLRVMRMLWVLWLVLWLLRVLWMLLLLVWPLLLVWMWMRMVMRRR